MSEEITRRGFITSIGLLGALGSGACLPRVTGTAGEALAKLKDPKENLQSMLRIQGSRREQDVPWWSNGTIYGVVGDSQPRPLVTFEGMEMYWIRHLQGPQAGQYELIGNTVTFFRDVDMGTMIDTFKNPYTGALNKVTPAVQGGGAGRGFNYSVQGIRPTAFIDQMPDKPLILNWSTVRDQIWMHNQTVYPPGLPPPRAQRQTMFANLEDFLNPEIDSLAAVFTSTVFMPWLKWMDMGNRPGHVIWHASGAKLESIEQLPSEYRRRAEAEFPERMTANPAAAVGD